MTNAPFPPKPRTLAYSCVLSTPIFRVQLRTHPRTSFAYCCVLTVSPIYIEVLGNNFQYLPIYKALFNFGGIKQGRDKVFFFRDTFFHPDM